MSCSFLTLTVFSCEFFVILDKQLMLMNIRSDKIKIRCTSTLKNWHVTLVELGDSLFAMQRDIQFLRRYRVRDKKRRARVR